MKYFIFRNYTIEPFFTYLNAGYSGYEDVSYIDETADIFIWFYLIPYELNNDTVVDKVQHYCHLLSMIHSNIGNDKEIIVFTLVPIYMIDYVTSTTAVENAIIDYNKKIYDMASANKNVKIINISGFYNTYSAEQLIDWKYYYISQIPINPKLAPQFKIWFLRQLGILAMKRKKCIVLDLDNTLWGGILGEDGIDGIKMGDDYPGNAYRFFQSYLMELSRAGIILSICSKNNELDVLKVLEQHPDMLLKRDMFSAYRINWNNKADNIKDIAQELNIGLDSMVFIDDNPAERDLIKQTLPQISVPEFPEHPYLYPVFIKQITDTYFSTYKLTKEDLSKTQQYKENIIRTQHKENFVDMDAYLQSLEIKLTIENLNEFNKARFAQMTQKTNQFNLTTKRYTETDIQTFADNGKLLYGLRVSDKFGDSGLSGLMIITIDKDRKMATIDTLLLSCRILGRNIEHAFVKYILMKLKSIGLTRVSADYIRTAKNIQTENFYDTIGFTIKDVSPDHKKYIFNLNGAEFDLSNIYELEDLCEKE